MTSKARFVAVALSFLLAHFAFIFSLPTRTGGLKTDGYLLSRFLFGPFPNISVCVPCRASEIPKLPILLKSIARGTMQPNEVVISISELSESAAEDLERDLRAIIASVRVVSTSAKQTAGLNRNRAAAVALGPVVTFFDADDEMHPQRIQVLGEAMVEFAPKCILHTYSTLKLDYDTMFFWRRALHFQGRRIFERVVEVDNLNGEIIDAGKDLQVPHKYNRHGAHHGHPTCQKSVVEAVPFPPDPRGQDARFLRRVLRQYGPRDDTMLFIDLPLSWYHPSEQALAEYAQAAELKARAKWNKTKFFRILIGS